MAVSAELLETLHRILRQLGDLRERKERGPRQVSAREASVAKLQSEHAAALDAVKQTKVETDRKNLELKANEAKIADWQVKLNTCNSNKEYQTMQEQIAAGKMAGSVLADEILELLEKIDSLEQAVAVAKQRWEAGQAELAKFRDAAADEGRVVAGDIARLEEQLKKEEQRLPGDARDDYQRVVRGKGGDALAAAEEGVCGGCGQQITLNMQNELLLGKTIFCKACGRLLYLVTR